MPRRLRSWTSKNSANVTLQPTPTIEDLPNEVLLRVLSYVNQEELLSTIPLVCKRWNALHDDPSLYRTLTFKMNNPSTSVAVKMINMAPWLTSLTMIRRRDTDKLLRHVGPNHPHLVKLVVVCCHGSPNKPPVASKHLINVARNCALLQNVSLVSTRCDSNTFYQQVGQMLPNLRIIDLGILEAINPGTLTNIVKYFNKIEGMRMMYSYLSLPAEEVLAFVERCRESLSVLDFKNSVVWSDALLASVGKCLNLKELNLENAEHITDNGLMAISHLSNVRHLGVREARNITSQCWLRFVHTPFMRGLHKLVIKTSNIDVHVLSAIGLTLRELVEFNIHTANIRFKGRMTTAMADLLASSSREADETPAQVETSSLLFPLVNHLTVVCSSTDNQVLSVVGRMRNLVHLDMEGTEATNQDIMVVAQLPNLLQLLLDEECRITKMGWIRFFESPNVTQLRCLKLLLCKNVDDSVACTIATNLRELEELHIFECKVTKKGRHQIKQLVSERCEVHFT